MVPPATNAGQTKAAKFGQPISRDGSLDAYCTPSKMPSAENAAAQVDLVAPGVAVLTPAPVWSVLFGSSE